MVSEAIHCYPIAECDQRLVNFIQTIEILSTVPGKEHFINPCEQSE